MVLDASRGRVWLALREGAGPSLRAYDATSGNLVERIPLREPLRLLGGHRANDVLVLLDEAGRLVHIELASKERIAVSDFATPAPMLPRLMWGPNRQTRSMTPGMRDDSGLILAADGTSVSAHDPATGAAVLRLTLPLADNEPVGHAALSADRSLLYVAAISSAAEIPGYGHGSRFLIVEVPSGRVIENRAVAARVSGWLAWDDALLVSWGFPKDVGDREELWVAGRRRAEVSESNVRWLLRDPSASRLVGWSPYDSMVLANPRSLELTSILSAKGARETADTGNLYWFPGAGHPYTFDHEAGRLLFWKRGPTQLAVFTPALAHEEAKERHAATLPPDAKIRPVHRAGHSSGRPRLLLADAGNWPEQQSFISQDGGDSWVRRDTYELALRPTCGVAAPDFERDPRVYDCMHGVGIVRSDDGGLSWQPAHGGLGSRKVWDIALSPAHADDDTLFATTFAGWQPRDWNAPQATAWRSNDAGSSWQAMGAFTALAVSPYYATDRRVMAFEYLGSRFHVSTDGGGTWESRGAIPSMMREDFKGLRLWVIPASESREERLLALATSDSHAGGGPQWPAAGGRLFQSRDGGWTWDLAWERDEDPSGFTFFDGQLFGPFDLDEHNPDRWLLAAELGYAGEYAVFVTIGERRWAEKRIHGPEGARIHAVTEAGEILVISGGLDTVHSLDPGGLVFP